MPRPCFDPTGKRIFIAGHRGMVGSALLRRLRGEPVELLTATRAELDLTRQSEVEAWMARHHADIGKRSTLDVTQLIDTTVELGHTSERVKA